MAKQSTVLQTYGKNKGIVILPTVPRSKEDARNTKKILRRIRGTK